MASAGRMEASVPSPGWKDAGSGDAAYNVPVVSKDALAGKHGEYDMVLASPPFGKKSSVDHRQRGGRVVERNARHQSRRFLGQHQQQATQLPAAHLQYPKRT